MRLATLAVCFAMCLGVAAGAQGTNRQAQNPRYACSHGLRPCWLPVLYWAVGECETQLNWRHNNSSYEGAFGFSKAAWRGYRYPGYPWHAWQATPWQQYRVIKRIGLGGNGCYVNGGYRYWMGRA